MSPAELAQNEVKQSTDFGVNAQERANDEEDIDGERGLGENRPYKSESTSKDGTDNATGPSALSLNHGIFEVSDRIRIKEEPIDYEHEVKQEPHADEVPMRRFMASEVDSNDQYNANDANSNHARSLLASASSKKRAQTSAESNSDQQVQRWRSHSNGSKCFTTS